MAGRLQREARAKWYNERAKKPQLFQPDRDAPVEVIPIEPPGEEPQFDFFRPGQDIPSLLNYIQDKFGPDTALKLVNLLRMQSPYAPMTDVEIAQRARELYDEQRREMFRQNYTPPDYKWRDFPPDRPPGIPASPVVQTTGPHRIPLATLAKAEFLQLQYIAGTRMGTFEIFTKGSDQFKYILDSTTLVVKEYLDPLVPGLFNEPNHTQRIMEETHSLQWIDKCRADENTLFFIAYPKA